MNEAHTEAIANADAHLNNAGLPTYSELLAGLRAAQTPLALYRGYGWSDRAGVVRKVDSLLDRIPA